MPLTDNINFLSPTGFKLTINREKYGNLEFFITRFSIPSISIGEVATNHRGAIGYVPGEVVTYDSLNINFAIDEDMNNYQEIFDWIHSNVSNQKIEYQDMILSVMSSHNNLNKQFQFRDAFPTNLSGIEFSTQNSDIEYLQADVTFRYGSFSIIR